MRYLIICSIAVLSLALAAIGIAAQPEVPADGIKMERTSMPVVFNHSTHTTAECAACHHPVNGVEDYRSCSTAGCHDNFDRKDKSVNSYYQVMHGKDLQFSTCVSCHQEVAGTDKEKRRLLTGCKNSACHTG